MLLKAKILFVVAALLLGSACTTTSTSNNQQARYLKGQSYNLVTQRPFKLRTAPNIAGKTITEFRQGDRFSAEIRNHDEIWHYLILSDGHEGYVFGIPFIEATGTY